MAQRRSVFVRLDADARTALRAWARAERRSAGAPVEAVLGDVLGRAGRFAAGTSPPAAAAGGTSRFPDRPGGA